MISRSGLQFEGRVDFQVWRCRSQKIIDIENFCVSKNHYKDPAFIIQLVSVLFSTSYRNSRIAEELFIDSGNIPIGMLTKFTQEFW